MVFLIPTRNTVDKSYGSDDKRLRNFNPSRGLEVTEVSNPSVIEPTCKPTSWVGKLKLAWTESEGTARTCGVPVKLEPETAREVENKILII